MDLLRKADAFVTVVTTCGPCAIFQLFLPCEMNVLLGAKQAKVLYRFCGAQLKVSERFIGVSHPIYDAIETYELARAISCHRPGKNLLRVEIES